MLLALWLQFLLFPKGKTAAQQMAVAVLPQSNPAEEQRSLPSAFHLFGGSKQSEISLANMVSQESHLNFIVTGIISGKDSKQGFAYIKTTKGVDEKKFKVGDNIFNKAKLTEIHNGYLIVQRNGKKERLSLHKGVGIDTKSGNRNSKSANNRQLANKTNNINNFNSGGNWQQVLNQQKYNPNKIANIAKYISVVQDEQGQINGLKVSALAKSPLLTNAGLSPNDRIVAVNGTKISTQNLLNLQKQLQNADNAQVTVIRNGRTITLNLNLAGLQ